jgi:hypothetical protein
VTALPKPEARNRKSLPFRRRHRSPA